MASVTKPVTLKGAFQDMPPPGGYKFVSWQNLSNQSLNEVDYNLSLHFSPLFLEDMSKIVDHLV